MADRQDTVTFDSVPEITTPEDLFALAAAMEREAARRYRQLAARMEALGEAALVDLFRRLEHMEAEHEAGLDAWARRAGVAESASMPRPAFRWDGAEGIGEKALAEVGGAEVLTPWTALSLAVHNEERAFAFYATVAARTADARVRAHAETMATEELEHVALLRLERRRAWRHQADAAGGAAEVRLETAAEVAAWQAALSPPQVSRAERRRLNAGYEALLRLIETTPDEALLLQAQEAAAETLRRLALLRDAGA